jgi:UDP-glucuronate decarboxylase
VLGWEPQIKVLDGLKETIEYFRKELAEPTETDSQGHGVGGPYGKKIELPFIHPDAKEEAGKWQHFRPEEEE